MSDYRSLGGGCCGGARLGRLGREVTVTDALTPKIVTWSLSLRGILHGPGQVWGPNARLNPA